MTAFISCDCRGVGKLVRKPVNHTSRTVVVVNPTNRPKSVHIRCVIKHFGDVFVCCRFALYIVSLCVGDFSSKDEVKSLRFLSYD